MMLCRRTGPGRICKGWRCLSICWNFQMTGERNTERFCAGTNGCTDTLNGEQWNERERERERAASRRKRTGCRETEPAGCCSAFKSCCGYSPPPTRPPHTHTHTHARTHARTHAHSRHALTLTAMSNRLIIYLLRSSQQCIKTRCFLQLLQFSCTLGTCILPRSLVDYFFIFWELILIVYLYKTFLSVWWK